MNKFFAREFLIIMVTAIIVGVLFLLQYVYDKSYISEIDQTNGEINKNVELLDSIDKLPKFKRPYALNVKDALLYKDPLEIRPLTKYAKNDSLFYTRLNSTTFLDSIYYFFESHVSGFNRTAEEFKEQVTTSKKRAKKVLFAPTEIQLLKSKLKTIYSNKHQTKRNYYLAMILVLILIYPVRLLIYLTRKSINTLKK